VEDGALRRPRRVPAALGQKCFAGRIFRWLRFVKTRAGFQMGEEFSRKDAKAQRKVSQSGTWVRLAVLSLERGLQSARREMTQRVHWLRFAISETSNLEPGTLNRAPRMGSFGKNRGKHRTVSRSSVFGLRISFGFRGSALGFSTMGSFRKNPPFATEISTALVEI